MAKADALLDDGVDVIVGPGTTGGGRQGDRQGHLRGVIMFSSATAAALFSAYDDCGLCFRSAPSDALRKPILADLVAGDGNRTVILMSRDDPWGNDMRQLAEE